MRTIFAFFPRLSGLSLGLVLAALLLLPACPLEFEDLNEPGILDVTVSPSQITQAQTGSTSDYFRIEISTANFDDELDPDRARAFIGNEERTASVGNAEVLDGSIIVLEEISYTWFQGYDPGDYQIGVEVRSDTASARALNQDIVRITQ